MKTIESAIRYISNPNVWGNGEVHEVLQEINSSPVSEIPRLIVLLCSKLSL